MPKRSVPIMMGARRALTSARLSDDERRRDADANPACTASGSNQIEQVLCGLLAKQFGGLPHGANLGPKDVGQRNISEREERHLLWHGIVEFIERFESENRGGAIRREDCLRRCPARHEFANDSLG